MSIKRILNSIKADIKFQIKHGFYAVYIILSLIYVIILSFINEDTLRYVVPILIYSDPAALGLFFIGGMVLLEKEQGVLALLYITPLKVYEYIISKIVSLGLIAALVGFGISLSALGTDANYFLLFAGTFMSSVFYTLIGFLIASKCKTVNEYLIEMVPIILLAILPCLTFIPNNFVPEFVNKIMLFVPSAGGLQILMGAFINVETVDSLIGLAGLIFVNALLVKRVSTVLTKKVIISA